MEDLSIYIGKTSKLQYTLFPAESELPIAECSSDMPEIVSVDNEGNVTGLAEGTANITVITYGGREYSCQVTVAVTNPSGLLGDLDLDGNVNSDDLTLLARHVGGIELVSGQALLNADVNGDGLVNSDDLTKHARYVGGIITDWDQE